MKHWVPSKARMHLFQPCLYECQWIFTIPGIKHVSDEIVDKGDLGFGNAAGIPIKHWHDDRQTLSFLFIRLERVYRNGNEREEIRTNRCTKLCLKT